MDCVEMTLRGREIPGCQNFKVINPANEEVVGFAPEASIEMLDDAVASARSAFPDWKHTPVLERAEYVKAIGRILREHADELSHILTSEQGKSLAAANAEIMGAAYWCDGLAGIEIPTVVLEESEDRRVEVRYVPHGVIGAIIPWNVPIILAIWKIAQALLTGNTIVLKPSPYTPLATLRLGDLLNDVLPKGVVNIISGGDVLGEWMTAHDGIDKITFTGSSATGAKVMASASNTLKHVTLELGGNDAAIVLPDANIEAMIEPLFWSAFKNTGQICAATKRLYVHSSIYNLVAEKLVEFAKSVVVGDGAQPGTMLGPIQNLQQYERVCDIIEDTKKQGIKFLVGGDIPQGKGFFLPVSLVDNPPDSARVVVEEQFGPILPILKFDDVDDVVRRANATPYGLTGSVWSANLVNALSIANRLEVGTVWINEVHYSGPHIPFAGHKKSGLGVENGRDGLMQFTRPQALSVRKV